MTRDEAIFYIKELQKTYASMDKKVAEAVDMAIEALSVERMGEWLEVDSWNSERHAVTDMRCSECNKYTSLVLPLNTTCTYPYCPNCGAKMEK